MSIIRDSASQIMITTVSMISVKDNYSFNDNNNDSVNDQGRDKVLGSPTCLAQNDDNKY